MLTRRLTKIASGATYTARAIYDVAGPLAMVIGERATLNDTGVRDDGIRTEPASLNAGANVGLRCSYPLCTGVGEVLADTDRETAAPCDYSH